MRAIAILACTTLAGCASSNVTPVGSPSVETVRVSSGNSSLTTATHPILASGGGTVAFPMERVWGVLRSVYDSLAIPVATVDPAGHVVGNPELKVRRRLGNIGLSQYINCGSTQGAPSADTYEVRLSVLTQAQPSTPTATSVMTTVEARARPITISGEYSLCTSTGVLESRIVELVRAQLRP